MATRPKDCGVQDLLWEPKKDRKWGLPAEHKYTGWVLPVNFDGKSFSLPLVTINPEAPKNERISINWLDCRQSELGQAIGRDLGKLIAPLVDSNTILITPPSSKSIGMATQALATAIQVSGRHNLDLIKISGGKTAEIGNQFELQSDEIIAIPDMQLWHAMSKNGNRFGVNYTPVTRTRKSMWFSRKEQELLAGKRVIAVDDVATTKATISAWELLLSACEIKEEFIVTAAVEGEFQPETNHLAMIRIPEIRGGVDKAVIAR
ncbi:MAG: hypothetical protein U1C50_02590 [Patescibacteria group bacterium]|nr:hypothetical protein [Patescibacteria group bacterium]MDP4030858.1 hypothetical protein [Candidatus Beckwithbacteria bacterium]MDZ4229119.1 hypothetical protein [Patescibacteria group bacterium]